MLTQLQELFSNGNKLYLPLLLFLLLDYATGVCVAVKKRELSSSIGFKGLTKKALIFVVVFLGWAVDRYILRAGTATESIVILFYLSNEGISILENLKLLGIPIPDILAAADELNGRPRKKLGYRPPEELFDEFLDSVYAAEGCGSIAQDGSQRLPS